MSAVYVVTCDDEPVAVFEERYEADLLAMRNRDTYMSEVYEVEYKASEVNHGAPQGQA
ncbi:hypothetical protein [uncultured Senegalimassilia sp.]|uniref:hypothetical protein n=1 Tax=uncultured Senegalimassilia sp. TaxID=1714350 RepID=UPI0025CECC3E|nr:hypothetical protein [uncultured Senegalimassilia sp.]